MSNIDTWYSVFPTNTLFAFIGQKLDESGPVNASERSPVSVLIEIQMSFLLPKFFLSILIKKNNIPAYKIPSELRQGETLTNSGIVNGNLVSQPSVTKYNCPLRGFVIKVKPC